MVGESGPLFNSDPGPVYVFTVLLFILLNLESDAISYYLDYLTLPIRNCVTLRFKNTYIVENDW